jgi:hypothetical protein
MFYKYFVTYLSKYEPFGGNYLYLGDAWQGTYFLTLDFQITNDAAIKEAEELIQGRYNLTRRPLIINFILVAKNEGK